MNHETALGAFCAESHELLAQMEDILFAATADAPSPEERHALFRCAHAIKGWAGLLGLDGLARFIHAVEDVLARLRSGEIALEPPLQSLLLDCREHIARRVAALGGDDAGVPGREAELIGRLHAYSRPIGRVPWPRLEEPGGHAAIVREGPGDSLPEERWVKVSSQRLDALIDQVGDLVIAAAALQTQARRSRQPELPASAHRLQRQVEGVSDTVLKLRMVPIAEVFSRLPRVVRDVARELGKEIRLKIVGADSQLDKSMLEKIGAPLAHLVCNAVDHGIEPEASRLLHGKPGTGTVRLIAYHEPDNFVIEVVDDGGGINCDKVLRKAREQGLLAPEETPSRQELFRLILEPGFSTADEVTPYSGRGVGMDVVKRSVEALCGTLDIDSEAGKGTIMRISLPAPAVSGVR